MFVKRLSYGLGRARLRRLGFGSGLGLGLAMAAALSPGSRAAAPTPPGPAGLARSGGIFFDVRDFGALADGHTKATVAIEQAIATATTRGGGTIYFGPGVYLTGPIHLRSHIRLWVDAGARLKFSDDFADYLPMVRSRWEGTEVQNFSPLIYGEQLDDVAIEGQGILDGQGQKWWQFFRELKASKKQTGKWKSDSKWQREFAARNPALELPDDPEMLKMGFLRPPFVQILDSRNVSIRDVKFVDSPFWTLNPVNCDDVTIRGVTILNPHDAPNTDGIDPESCRNVHIADCHIDVGDDCITIKSGRDAQGRRLGRPAENYTITNCTMLHGHGGVVIGSEMSGGVRNIVASNCVFEGTDRGIRIKSTRGRGGIVENVRFSNIVMHNIVHEAITVNLSYTNAPREPVSERTPTFRNIQINAVSGDADLAGTLQGLPETLLDDVGMFDVRLKARQGFVVKDARNVRLVGVRVDTQSGPALTAVDVEGLMMTDVGTQVVHPRTATVELSNVVGGFVRGCFAAPGTDVFLRVAGKGTRALMVDGNDWQAARTPVEVAADVPKGALTPASAATATPTAR